MPGFLKSLFKPEQARPTRRAGPIPPDLEFSPTPSKLELRDEELQVLADILRRHLAIRGETGHNGDVSDMPREGEEDGTMTKLLDLLEQIRDTREERKVTPFLPTPPPRGNGRVQSGGTTSVLQKSKHGKGKDKARGDSETSLGAGPDVGEWHEAFRECSACLGR